MPLPARVPRFAELPITPAAPPRSSWGVFGADDQLGTLNFLTPARRLAALRLVQRGVTFNLDLPLHLPSPPMFAVRTPFRHTVLHRPNTFGRDDYVDGLYLQGSTQWDALKHISHPEHGFYNGADDARIDADVALLGVQAYAAAGIVGRGVLLDVERFLAARGEVLPPDTRREITAGELDAVAAAAGVVVEPGDILMLRTGVARLVHAEGADPTRAVRPYPGGPGLAANAEMLGWLWDHQVAAVVSDNLTVEAFPMGPGSLHRTGIALLGLVIGELFDFEMLAADCAQDGQVACLFVAKPLNLRGGVGSPGNALALK